jgi:hypothetical protein
MLTYSEAGNPVYRPAGRPEHEEVPHGQRQGSNLVYQHGILYCNPEPEGEGEVSNR